MINPGKSLDKDPGKVLGSQANKNKKEFFVFSFYDKYNRCHNSEYSYPPDSRISYGHDTGNSAGGKIVLPAIVPDRFEYKRPGPPF